MKTHQFTHRVKAIKSHIAYKAAQIIFLGQCDRTNSRHLQST